MEEDLNVRRAPVQGDLPRRGGYRVPGTIIWDEHVQAWEAYRQRYSGQSAERIAERGGFGYEELVMFLGHEPKTWEPRKDRD